MIPAKFRYIAVEGPIGAGKTSLAKLLAERFAAELLLEDPASNPFLPDFYRDMRRYALPAQLHFLVQRVKQLSDLKRREDARRATVADFLLDKDPLFARLNLAEAEYALYSQIFERLQVQVQPTAPDLVIYLQAPLEDLIQRVQRRGHRMERGISEDYLRRLNDSYAKFFYDYDQAPLLIVNSENLNFVDRPADFELLLEHIQRMRGGREFFNRAA